MLSRGLWLIVKLGLVLPLLGAACRAGRPAPTSRPTETRTEAPSSIRVEPTATAEQSPTPAPPTATQTRLPPASGPGYAAGLNPLTGLPHDEVASLRRSPVLVAITNFPPSSRPQVGLSQAAQVWETSIGQGLTRFLAVYYGDYPERLQAMARPSQLPYGFVVGPVRSGRVAFETIRTLYPGGLLVTRAASPEVLPQLNRHISINARNPDDVNSAGLTVRDLKQLPEEPADPASFAHFRFDPMAPGDGNPAPDLRLIFNRFAHVGWRYDPAAGSYLRLQDSADGQGQLSPQLDRLTGEPLRFQNVVVLFARHSFENVAGTILEIELSFVPERYGLLFRDGVWQEIAWSSRRAELRLFDEEGELVPLKPGRTFFEVVSYRSTWDSEDRLIRYHNPPLPTLTPVPTPTPTQTSTPTASPTPTASDTPVSVTETVTPGP